uniref:Uncharacterized protein n=1 Tax=Octopus bimaculoides TaxID=37653 RepID=A0A0L8HG94_OCTBM
MLNILFKIQVILLVFGVNSEIYGSTSVRQRRPFRRKIQLDFEAFRGHLK